MTPPPLQHIPGFVAAHLVQGMVEDTAARSFKVGLLAGLAAGVGLAMLAIGILPRIAGWW